MDLPPGVAAILALFLGFYAVCSVTLHSHYSPATRLMGAPCGAFGRNAFPLSFRNAPPPKRPPKTVSEFGAPFPLGRGKDSRAAFAHGPPGHDRMTVIRQRFDDEVRKGEY